MTRTAIAAVTGISMMVGFGVDPASADPRQSDSLTVQADAAHSPQSAVVRREATELRAGRTVVLQSGNSASTVRLQGNALVVTTAGAATSGPAAATPQRGICTAVVFAAVAGLGAAGIAALIAGAVVSGAEVIAIAGYEITLEAAKAILGLLGSTSALYAYIGAHVC